MSRALCWIRRDLRLSDHRALEETCKNFNEVVVVFVFDTVILDSIQNRQDRRVTFIVQSLQELDAKLRESGSGLVIRYGDPFQEIPRLAKQLAVDAVITARDYDPYAIRRDTQVSQSLISLGIKFKTLKDQVIFEQGEVLSKVNSPFRVFTPYSRRWLELLEPRIDAASADPDLTKLLSIECLPEPEIPMNYEAIGFLECEPWLEAGESAAQAALHAFESKIGQYGEARDIPSLNGTSFLSVHLRFGTISIREAIRLALRHESTGAKKWLTELIWRDFYQDVLANHPEVVETTFEPAYANLPWPGTVDQFEAWKAGQTGYPIIDAAMRCFNETGWMHNRLRMVVASFLTKDLLVHYKWGEKYFADHLLDFDLASNNGGWQWAASVGCDAQPYFRIFNPTTQSERFDSEGAFIREWVPELANLDSKSIHQPTEMQAIMTGYPTPMVDHSVQRDLAISLFKQAKNNPS